MISLKKILDNASLLAGYNFTFKLNKIRKLRQFVESVGRRRDKQIIVLAGRLRSHLETKNGIIELENSNNVFNFASAFHMICMF